MTVNRAFVQNLLKKHMPKFTDSYVECQYISYSGNTASYDASDGSKTDISIQFSVNGIVADFSFNINQSGFKEIEASSIQDRDKKAIIITSEFNGIVPKKDDLLIVDFSEDVDTTGFSNCGFGNPCLDLPSGIVKYSIKGMNVDPYKGVYLLHLRPSDDP